MKNKIIQLLRSKNIDIPDDDNELTNLFLGFLVVNKIDYWIDRSSDFIDNEKPEKPFEREWSEIAKQDTAYRSAFTQLNDEAKVQLKELLRESVKGVVFSILSELDNDDWAISLKQENISTMANENGSLHEDLYNWINLFGK